MNIVSLISYHKGVEVLLIKFRYFFKEPHELPPTSVVDHHIPLKEGATLVSSRPYRYSLPQKNVIENMVEKMLRSGIIWLSSSPYSTSIVLVRMFVENVH